MFARLRHAALVCLFTLAVLMSSAFAQTKNPVQTTGKYSVELRIPATGVYAGEETDIEFRITDTSRVDPVLGAVGVIRAAVKAVVTMPAMASMPPALPKIHSEGVPGDYGLVTTFPHGGEYNVALTITPRGDSQPFTVRFGLPVRDEDDSGKRKRLPPPYTVSLKSAPERPVAGVPVALTLQVRERATGEPVTAFDTVHEQKMHLIIVRDDLGLFFHEHPMLNSDGTFTHTFTFPTGGNWRLFGDCAPVGAGSQVLLATIKVDGKAADRMPLLVTPSPRIIVDNAVILLKTQTLPARTTLPLTFAVTNTAGKPLTDLQPWLGAMAHLILIERDATTFVHSHPDETDPANGKNGTITFLARFPKPGIYKGWVQFQETDTVKTFPFVVRATEP